MDAVTRLADLLDEETSAALIGDASKASDFTRRKAESEHEIRRHARRAEEAGVRIPASRREDAVAILTRLEEASTRNASCLGALREATRSEEHTSELQSLMRISYAVFCLKKK